MDYDVTVYAFWNINNVYSSRSINSIMNEETLNSIFNNSYVRLNKTGAELNAMGISNISITIRVYLSENTTSKYVYLYGSGDEVIASCEVSGTAGEYVDVTFNVSTSELNTANKIDITYSGVLTRPINLTVSYS